MADKVKKQNAKQKKQMYLQRAYNTFGVKATGRGRELPELRRKNPGAYLSEQELDEGFRKRKPKKKKTKK